MGVRLTWLNCKTFSSTDIVVVQLLSKNKESFVTKRKQL